MKRLLLLALGLVFFFQLVDICQADDHITVLQGCVKQEDGYLCPTHLDEKFSEAQLLSYRYADKSIMATAKDYYRKALTYERKENLEVARLYYIKTIRTCPSFIEAYVNLGNVLICLGEYDEAIKAFFKVRQLSSNYFPIIYNNIGLAYEKKGETNTAIEYYKLAVNLDPKNVLANHNLASLYYRLNQNDKAAQYWKTISNISPGLIPLKIAKHINEY